MAILGQHKCDAIILMVSPGAGGATKILSSSPLAQRVLDSPAGMTGLSMESLWKNQFRTQVKTQRKLGKFSFILII